MFFLVGTCLALPRTADLRDTVTGAAGTSEALAGAVCIDKFPVMKFARG